ncbi:FUS1 [Candida theae]|uniref:FUS1 n=1 Tax=Candida theae TaxID=1198502 RepID=A0AAD5BGJ3_9ASCO|nr:FUS1 [Candida theae]KAI5961282.1 FUS1 [Candida theae]
MSPTNDATLIMTLTRTATLSSESSDSNGAYLSWAVSTLTTQMVVSSAVTYSISPTATTTQKRTTLQSAPTPTSSLSPTTSLESRQSSSPSASHISTSAASDISSGLQFNDIPTSNSTQVGVAVGVPIAIFAVFFVAMAVWYFLRLRRSKREFNQDNVVTTSAKPILSNQNYSRPSWETLTEKPYPVVFSPTNYLHPDKEYQVYEQHQPHQASNLKQQLNRLSRLWPARDKEQELSSQEQPSLLKRMSVMTPVFLKKFNISNGSGANREVIKSQVLDVAGSKGPNYIASNNEPHFGLKTVGNRQASSRMNMYTVTTPYTKSLDDELTIRIGDKCTLLEKYSDGWCKIRLSRKNGIELDDSEQKIGLVPLMCLEGI